MKYFLLIGPVTPPLGGEALAFKVVVEHLKKDGVSYRVIDKAKYKGYRLFFLLNPIYFLLTLLYNSINCRIVYLTSGSNFLGKTRDIITAVIVKLFNKKVVYHIHGNALIDLTDKSIINYLYKLSINSFEHLIVLSNLILKELKYINPNKKISIVPNSIFPETPIFTCNSPAELKQKKDEIFSLLYMSHVLPSKGIFDVLDALIAMDSEGYDFYFHFAGSLIKEDGYSVNELKSKIGYYQTKLNDKFIMHGFIDKTSKWELLLNSKIFLLPTQFYSEGLPISIIEAMYFGNTIITTRWRAIPDLIIENHNGFFVNYNKPNEILNILKELYQDREKIYTIGFNNYIEVQKKYLPQHFEKNILDILYQYK